MSKARAVVSLSTSATTGYFRDNRQDAHVPLFTQLAYTGLHSGGVESHLDLSLNNDFYENVWKAYPTQASIVFPLSNGFVNAPFRKSRVQLGRQLLAESFDLSLFDGVQAPIYWSATGGLWPYAGTAHTMDGSEPVGYSLFGMSAFQHFGAFKVRGGYSTGGENNHSQIVYGSLFASSNDILLAPEFLAKTEWDILNQDFSQSLTQLELNLSEDISIGGRHSYRRPRRVQIQENLFLYRIFAFSPLEQAQATSAIQLSDSVRFEVIHGVLRFKTGQLYEWGNQQSVSLSWALGHQTFLTPSFHHTDAYGGELWDGGLQFQTPVSDSLALRSELAAANFEKINRISGWAYQTRNGLDWLLAPRLTVSGWVELERNHLFDFDARIFANVAYYQ